MKRYPSFFLTMLILVLGVTTSALAFTFTIIGVPGARNTEALAINNQGQIIGIFFEDSNIAIHGFLRDKNGTFTTVDPPGSTSSTITIPRAITDSGQIVGSFFEDSRLLVAHGFLRDKDGTFTTIDVPGAPFTIIAVAINNSGQIIENIFSFAVCPPGPPALVNAECGFLRDKNGIFTLALD